jgi:hypothetical protein
MRIHLYYARMPDKHRHKCKKQPMASNIPLNRLPHFALSFSFLLSMSSLILRPSSSRRRHADEKNSSSCRRIQRQLVAQRPCCAIELSDLFVSRTKSSECENRTFFQKRALPSFQSKLQFDHVEEPFAVTTADFGRAAIQCRKIRARYLSLMHAACHFLDHDLPGARTYLS